MDDEKISLIEMSDANEKNRELIHSVLDQASDDEHFLKCMNYVTLRETRRNMSHQQIADYFNVTPNTIKAWQIKWTESGLIKRCRKLLAIPANEEIKVANELLIRDWPTILNRQRNIAVHGKSDRNATEAAKWLYETVVQPYINQQAEAGVEELDYVEIVTSRATAVNPFSIQEVSDSDE